MAALSERPAQEVVRIEAVAEGVARRGGLGRGLPQSLRRRVGSTSVQGAVGLKTIVAYRTTFDIDQTTPSAAEVQRRQRSLVSKPTRRRARIRLDEADVVRHGLWIGAELCRDRGLPLQIHVGFGDPGHHPARLRPDPFHRVSCGPWRAGPCACTLLHNYPFQREAAWLAEIFQNVYYDVGVILNFAGPTAADILGEALEMGPFFKQLYSSDAFGLAELYYLGQLLFRRALQERLDRWIAEDLCNLREADRIVAMIARDNAARIYPLDGARTAG